MGKQEAPEEQELVIKTDKGDEEGFEHILEDGTVIPSFGQS